MHCRYCPCNKIQRMRREGFLQNKVYPLFGFYPWRCPECKTRYLLRSRGAKHTRPQSAAGAQSARSEASSRSSMTEENGQLV
jgi:hypothetical protein